MQTNIITLILIEQVLFLLDLLFVVSKFAYRHKRKGSRGKTIDASSLEKTMAAALALKA